ncbi:monosaccharide-transporting ATPase [Aureimonas endophytica]|uniref:Monosaccharide-transporting ATPase n=1 Tax=Aureimonas endophytica TaxID=2027858 RepID=A0A916ZRK5_9HYPH|nr:ABC transporter permease [Aureimonas endophytica]GGE10908.1 monosaccharide-transporting ATPase [Aureimonas endophytica]
MTSIATTPPPRRLALPALRELAIRSGIFVLLALLVIGFTWQEPAFLRVANLFSILQAVAIVALLGIGVTVSSAVGGFDLSVGALAALTQMASAYILIVHGGSTFEAVAGALAIGVLVGLFNSLLIVALRVPDLLATLGTLFLLAGAQLIPTGGRSIAPGMVLLDGSTAEGSFTEAFLALGRLRLGGVVPVPVVILAAVAFVAWFLMERTRWGRVFYAVGGSPTAAYLAGAPVNAYRVAAYVLSSAIAALGGVLLAARIGRGDVSAGNSLMLDAVAASLIGYAVLGANRPNVFGTVVGAVFVGVLLNGLTMLNAPYYLQDFVKGAVLIGALALTFGLARRRA